MDKKLIKTSHYVEISYKTLYNKLNKVKEITERELSAIDLDERIKCFRFYDVDIYVTRNGIEKSDRFNLSPWIYNGRRIDQEHYMEQETNYSFTMPSDSVTISEYANLTTKKEDKEGTTSIEVLDAIMGEISKLYPKNYMYSDAQTTSITLDGVRQILEDKKQELMYNTKYGRQKAKKDRH